MRHVMHHNTWLKVRPRWEGGALQNLTLMKVQKNKSKRLQSHSDDSLTLVTINLVTNTFPAVRSVHWRPSGFHSTLVCPGLAAFRVYGNNFTFSNECENGLMLTLKTHLWLLGGGNTHNFCSAHFSLGSVKKNPSMFQSLTENEGRLSTSLTNMAQFPWLVFFHS